MKIVAPVLLLVAATVLITLSGVASFLASPLGMDSRDVLVVATGLAGAALGTLAAVRLARVNRAWVAR